MRIAIIGGRGLIGRALAGELKIAGHEPVLLSRHAQSGESLDGMPVQRWDGVSARDLIGIIDGLDAVVNLAGENIGARRWTKERLQLLYDSRILPGKALAEAWTQVKNPPAILIQASAVGFYGISDREVTESTAPGGDVLARLCQAWEAATLPVTRLGTRRVVIRSGVVLDRQKGILGQMVLPFHFFVGGPIGRGNQWISWIHIQDEARAIRFLLENPVCEGTYNLTSPIPVTNAEFGQTIASILHRPYWFRVPAFFLKFALGEMSILVLEGQKVMPERLGEAGFVHSFPDLPGALRDLLVED